MKTYNDTIPDKQGFTDLDIYEIANNPDNLSNWNEKEQTYIKNKYKKELLQAIELLERIAEEAGLYGEAKEQTQQAVENIRNFIENRI